MTNYNERLDEILNQYASDHWMLLRFPSQGNREIKDEKLAEAKQAILRWAVQALKELKEEVIGEVPSKMNTDNWKYDRRVAELKLWQHQAIDNKIKALEEV